MGVNGGALALSSTEREEIGRLDKDLFGRIEPLKKILPETHTVYPDFFTTEMGWRAAVLVYLNPAAKEEEVGRWAQEHNLPYETENDKRKAGDKFFEELLVIATDGQKFKII